jgi:hypothetical protein
MQRRRYADDDIFRVHSRFLGPKGKTLPFSIPYRGIVPGLAAFVLTLMVLSAFGVGLWRFVIAAGLAAGAGKLTDLYSSAERPVSSLPVIFSHETGAPRPRRRETVHVVLRPGLIPVRDPGTAPKEGRRR